MVLLSSFQLQLDQRLDQARKAFERLAIRFCRDCGGERYHLLERNIHVIGLSEPVLDDKEEVLDVTPVVHPIVGFNRPVICLQVAKKVLLQEAEPSGQLLELTIDRGKYRRTLTKVPADKTATFEFIERQFDLDLRIDRSLPSDLRVSSVI
jgi:hypothetical protein